MEHSALAHLPDAFFAVAPELRALALPVEERATCNSCAVGNPAGEATRLRPLNQQTKCCTYHPTHPNWLVGRALRRGGHGAAQVRKRMTCMDDGISVVGIGPSKELKQAWLDFEDPWTMFGQLPEYLCPYFDRGTTGCTIWQDRGGICRTWFCKHTDGQRGYELWGAVRRVLKSVERRLAAWCILYGEPPDEHEWGDPDIMMRWYVRCADLVDALSAEEAAGLRDKVLLGRIAHFASTHEQHNPPIPDIVGPSIGWFQVRDDGPGVYACGHSGMDTVTLPDGIFELLHRLDGKTPWRQAAAEANDRVQGRPFDEAFMLRLFRLGLLESRDPNEPAPPPGASMSVRGHLPRDDEDSMW